MNKEFIIVLSTYRSGSKSLIQFLDKYYKKNKTNHINLDEYFTVDKGKKLLTSSSQVIKKLEYLEEINYNNILLKVHTDHIFLYRKFLYNFLKNKKATVIALERKNKYEQLLSFVIARSTGKTYKPHSQPVPVYTPNQFEASFFSIRNFLVGLEYFFVMQEELKRITTVKSIAFEDFIRTTSVLEDVLPGCEIVSGFGTKENTDNKETYVKNANELKKIIDLNFTDGCSFKDIIISLD